MRPLLGRLHLWVGLALAGFLIVSGLSGAVIAWNDEIDSYLNPHLARASEAPRFAAAELARRLETDDPRLRVTYLLIAPKTGGPISIFVQPRTDPATGRAYQLGFDQVFMDPATADVLARRSREAVWPLTRETFIPFVYRLHHSLHMPAVGGIERIGRWITGVIALAWTIDCLVGFLLTLPGRARLQDFAQRWRRAWVVRGGSRYRRNFDSHRAIGSWIWLLLFCMAFTGFSVNLYREVFYPVLSTVSQVTPTPSDLRKPSNTPVEPQVSFADIQQIAARVGHQRGWTLPVGAIVYTPRTGIYQVRFFAAGQERGAAGLGPIRLFFDATSGALLGERLPGEGTAADLFVQAQYPVHSGRIFGLPGRIAVTALGLLTAILSVTGVAIWLMKARARQSRAQLPSGR
jgi:uncharacterized iron-regulated membrane protein